MKENIKCKIIYLSLFIIVLLLILNTSISFATDSVTESKEEILDGTFVIRTVLKDQLGLDVSQASELNKANIQLYEYVGENQQKFKVKHIGDGYYTITAVHSGKVLDVARAEKKDGTNVWQHELNNTDAQKWMLKKTEDGNYNIISKCNGLYLNVAGNTAKNGANIQVNTKNESNAQKFKLEKIKTIEGKQTIANGTYVIKTLLNEKLALDVSQVSKDNGANIQIYEYVKENQQKFKVKYVGNGYYTITALHSGKVLDVAGAGKKDGTNVWQHESNNTDAQKWVIEENEDGNYNIISKCNDLYLTVAGNTAKNGANIQVNAKKESNAQKFKFEEANETNGATLIGKQTIPDGVYSIATSLNEKHGLDVDKASKNNGANIQLYEYVGANQQKFYVKYVGSGYYIITSIHSRKVLDVANAGKKPGTNVWQHESNNTDAQKWIIVKNEDESYNIISKCNELYLDVTNSAVKNGTNIRVYTGNNANAQKFKFIKANILCEEGTYGKSGLAIKGDSRGANLKYYKFGQGKNILFATFSIHGFEDSYAHDGKELTYIAEQFKTYLSEKSDMNLYNNWTIYILPTLNPDGQTYGTTNNGEGRTTLYSAAPNHKGIDMNRNFQTSDYVTYKDDRNYNGTEAFQAYEARYLRDFLLNNKSQNGQTILIDLHGWLDETMGDDGLGAFYRSQLGMTKHISTYGRGYLINWARMSLGNSNKVAKSALIELPQVNSHEELVNKKYAEKYINATINMLKSIK